MRRTSIAVCTVALTATLGGCALGQSPGGSAESGSGDSASQGGVFGDLDGLVSAASSAMEENKSYKLSMTATLGEAGGMQSDCQVDAAREAMSCTGSTGETIMIDGDTYLNSPQLNSLGGEPGKPWARIAEDSPASSVNGAQTAALSEAGDFRKLLPEGSRFTPGGTETVNGEETTRYDVVTDVNKVIATAEEGIVKQSYEMLLRGGITELTQTVWVDEEGRPVKVEQITPPMTISGQRIGESTTTLSYSGWGEPVSVAAPDPSQVREFTMPGLPQPPG
ncbi:hypothetical protein ACL03H_23105 [Saccharopolyspora sp. MS10]|uniref:hypothetical protein n=1 Tax=Saccharopolyspora sp. MS10 TaxID=3385973 RepID=UPI0039A2AE87